MKYLEEIDHRAPEFGDLYDELPLWSAPFGLMLLEQVQIRPGITILDVGAGTGFMTIELAQRCGLCCHGDRCRSVGSRHQAAGPQGGTPGN